MAVMGWLAGGCGVGSPDTRPDDPALAAERDERGTDQQTDAATDAELPDGESDAAANDRTSASDPEDETAQAPSADGSDDEALQDTEATPATCDGSGSVGSVESELRRLSDAQYRNSIESIFAGLIAPSEQYPAASGSTVTGYSSELGHEPMSEQDVERAALAAEDIAVQVPDNIDALLSCAADANQACAETFLDDYGARIYRRPLDDEERELLLDDFGEALADDFTFAEAIGVMVAHMLQTPQFLYVVEDAAPERRELSPFELAHRLSLLFWDSLPDAELLAAAEDGELSDARVVRAQAERLLSSERADATLVRFFREWTQASTLFPGDKSEESFPEFDAELAASMNESFERMVLDAVRSGSSLRELLSSSDAWVDERLASFFAVPAPESGWERVSLDQDTYRGLLTQPAWLASLAHSDDTSFVFRGRFVQKRLLCNEFGPPPANAMSTEFELPEDPTALQRSEAVRANPSCAGCHELMDPIGLAFESFDAIGQYRSEDDLGRRIDTTGTLLGASEPALEFADHLQLIAALQDDPKTLECYARQVYRFATAHRESGGEACAVADVHEALLAADGELGAALLAVASGEAFRHREAP